MKCFGKAHHNSLLSASLIQLYIHLSLLKLFWWSVNSRKLMEWRRGDWRAIDWRRPSTKYNSQEKLKRTSYWWQEQREDKTADLNDAQGVRRCLPMAHHHNPAKSSPCDDTGGGIVRSLIESLWLVLASAICQAATDYREENICIWRRLQLVEFAGDLQLPGNHTRDAFFFWTNHVMLSDATWSYILLFFALVLTIIVVLFSLAQLTANLVWLWWFASINFDDGH